MTPGGVDRGGGCWGTVHSMLGVVWRATMTTRSGWRAATALVDMTVAGVDERFCSLSENAPLIDVGSGLRL